MVRGAWTGDDPWLVVAPGSPSDVRDARSPRATAFPDTRGGRPFADDLSHIAHLEALRYAGHRHLVLPEGSRPWFRQQSELRDHVVRTYRTLADQPGAGAVFDLGQPAEEPARSLRAAMEHLSAGGIEPRPCSIAPASTSELSCLIWRCSPRRPAIVAFRTSTAALTWWPSRMAETPPTPPVSPAWV